MRRGLQPTQVAQVVQLIQDGTSMPAVPARRSAVSVSTVSRAWSRYQKTGQYTRRHGENIRRLIGSMPRCCKEDIKARLLFNDVYAASKFAAEGFCESLAVQALRFNVKTTLVEPGPVVTEFEKKVYEEAQNMDLSGTDKETARIFREVYLPYSRRVFSSLGQTPEEVAEQTYQLIVSHDPPFRHQTNRVYTPVTAMKHADPTGRLPVDAFYRMIFQHDRVFNASLGILRLLRKRKSKV